MKRLTGRTDILFPAQAGVIPPGAARFAAPAAVPRASGGDPMDVLYLDGDVVCSPRKRG